MPTKTTPKPFPSPTRSLATLFAVHWAAFRRDALDHAPGTSPETLAAFEAATRLFYFKGRTDELMSNSGNMRDLLSRIGDA